tara:strand:+ start:159 stop:329 length:171 start_codon:yes stop_codon:yes gene_type:complete
MRKEERTYADDGAEVGLSVGDRVPVQSQNGWLMLLMLLVLVLVLVDLDVVSSSPTQ